MKYRILQINNYFYPQERFMLFWFNITLFDYETYHNEEVKFKTLKEATDFLDDYTCKQKPVKSPKVIHNYERK
jgi:hypothetical protein